MGRAPGGKNRVERVHVIPPEGPAGKYVAHFTREGVRLLDTKSGAAYSVDVRTGEAVLIGEFPGAYRTVQVSKGGLDKIRGILAANRV